MPVVTFTKQVAFPIAAARLMLSQHLPLYKWQCGEDDNGADKQLGAFHSHILITGRSASTVIFVELRAEAGPLEGPAFPHEFYVRIGEPTTDLAPIADRIKLAICAALMFMDEQRSVCQLRPGGNWLRIEDLFKTLELVVGGEDLSVADGLGIPSARVAEAVAAARAMPPEALGSSPLPAPTAPSAPRGMSMGETVKRMLTPLILMLDRPLAPNWWQIEEFARKVDPEGGWSYVAVGGENILAGRGTRLFVDDKAEPVPDYVYDEAFTRSFWFEGDRSAVARHARHIAIGTALDTARADWVTTRQVAKVATMVAGVLARLPGTVAVLNLTVGTIFQPEMVGNFLSILGRDQLPVPLWTFTAPHSLEDGDICLLTSGLLPFLGHEIEVWHAPLSREAVADKVSNLIIYLLDRGPVIGHGDTAGYVEGEKSIRCSLGPGRAERAEPVQALFLEFGEPEAIQPKADLPESPPPPMSPEEADRFASEIIDEALQSAMARSQSPGFRKILNDISEERAARSTGPSAQGRRAAGGFGRKGL